VKEERLETDDYNLRFALYTFILTNTLISFDYRIKKYSLLIVLPFYCNIIGEKPKEFFPAFLHPLSVFSAIPEFRRMREREGKREIYRERERKREKERERGREREKK